MDLRYMGFDQTRNTRVYRFDCKAADKSVTQCGISVDIALFSMHRVGIQEGPALCALKLTANFEAQHRGDDVLTNDDLLAYVAVRSAAEARKAESRRRGSSRRKPEAGQASSPWRR